MHPSGLLALSTGRDDMLRMWNMAKGRSQYKTKIAPGTESVSFSPEGGAYALLSSKQVPLMALPCSLPLAASLCALVNQLSMHAACRAEVRQKCGRC